MISYDLECCNGHRFEGVFKDFQSYQDQLNMGLVSCPLCESNEVKQLFTGCSIQTKTTGPPELKKENTNIFEMIRLVNQYVKKNFQYVGESFAEETRAMYYGLKEEKSIYGESTPEDVKELAEEGIGVMVLPDIDKLEN